MSQIKQSSIEGLKSIIDIVDLIGNFIEVKKNGSSFVAICPFHDDKNPSMSISLQKGLYHCHACGAGGDSIKFIMEHENLGFGEAIEFIARFFNYPLEYEKGFAKKIKSDILPLMADFYHQNLFRRNDILDYLKSRGLDNQTIEEFKIGYCGASFESVRYIQESGLNINEALKYGILIKNTDKFYARFSNRIIFPILSPTGVVIGFGGRTLSGEKNIAKYINSAQSEIFNKSRVLYGLNIARNYIHKKKSIIIVEGYMDAILLHKNGFKNTVATLGTAFNEGHIGLLKKEEVEILACFDGDSAGLNAGFRASKILAQNSRDGGVVVLRDGLDPADIMQKNPKEFEKLCNDKISFVEFVLSEIINNYDLRNPMQKQNALREIIEFLNTLTPILQREYVSKVAFLLNIDRSLIKVKSSKNNIEINLKPQIKDIAEARVLFSMMHSDECFFEVLNYLNETCFESCAEEFRLISKNELDNKTINEFRFIQDAMPLNLVDLREQIRLLLIRYCKKRLKNITNENLDISQKLDLIKAIKQNILTLESGKLVTI